jgi:hypothetical protein
LNHRLPALEKIITHSIQNTMDLDEDLPMNPVNELVPNQRQIYTSPGKKFFFYYRSIKVTLTLFEFATICKFNK